MSAIKPERIWRRGAWEMWEPIVGAYYARTLTLALQRVTVPAVVLAFALLANVVMVYGRVIVLFYFLGLPLLLLSCSWWIVAFVQLQGKGRIIRHDLRSAGYIVAGSPNVIRSVTLEQWCRAQGITTAQIRDVGEAKYGAQ